MRYSITIALIALIAVVATPVLAGDVWVDGYTRDDGTYVEGHYRTEPNQYEFDNYSADGNINPYTGEEGTKDHEFSNDYDTDFDSGFDSDYDTDPYDGGLYD